MSSNSSNTSSKVLVTHTLVAYVTEKTAATTHDARARHGATEDPPTPNQMWTWWMWESMHIVLFKVNHLSLFRCFIFLTTFLANSKLQHVHADNGNVQISTSHESQNVMRVASMCMIWSSVLPQTSVTNHPLWIRMGRTPARVIRNECWPLTFPWGDMFSLKEICLHALATSSKRSASYKVFYVVSVRDVYIGPKVNHLPLFRCFIFLTTWLFQVFGSLRFCHGPNHRNATNYIKKPKPLTRLWRYLVFYFVCGCVTLWIYFFLLHVISGEFVTPVTLGRVAAKQRSGARCWRSRNSRTNLRMVMCGSPARSRWASTQVVLWPPWSSWMYNDSWAKTQPNICIQKRYDISDIMRVKGGEYKQPAVCLPILSWTKRGDMFSLKEICRHALATNSKRSACDDAAQMHEQSRMVLSKYTYPHMFSLKEIPIITTWLCQVSLKKLKKMDF